MSDTDNVAITNNNVGSLAHNSAATSDIVIQLVNSNLITTDQAKVINEQAQASNKSKEDIILSGLFVDSDKMIDIKSMIFKIPIVDLINLQIPIETLQKIPADLAKKYNSICFEFTADHAKVAMVDPLDVQAVNFLRAVVGVRIETYFARPDDVKKIINTRYGAQVGYDVSRALEDVKDGVSVKDASSKIESLEGDIASAPVARIVNEILEYAVRMKASDIHIEPREGQLIVRNRINGILSVKLVLPLKLAPAVVSRVKILANLKIDEHRIPQDGRFQATVDNERVDLRISVLPTVYGEKVVMRILEKDGGAMTLDKTGLYGRNLNEFMNAIKKTLGIILITGPTGSGKTVTLASCLKILNKEKVNILTLEDPVEIRIDGVNQVQVNAEIGLTFANGLRAFLRQDPNIIMVGEIRDSETAKLAVQAALTGHLVLSTLHTNTSSAAIPRLIDMGVEPFLLSSTINIVAAQRLIRRICPNCKRQHIATEDELEIFRKELHGIKGFNFEELLAKHNGEYPLYKGEGCEVCGHTGYKGRLGIFEVMPISDPIRKLINDSSTAQKIEEIAKQEGMTSMLQDGLFKVLQGESTIEEVYRVIS